MPAPTPHQTLPARDGQRECARGPLCTARTRDPETAQWHPAPATQPLCPACTAVMTRCLTELPAMYERAGELLTDPGRRTGRAVRIPPGSRVLLSAEADALMREAATVLAGWAARIRALLSLTRPRTLFGTPERFQSDCGVLAAEGRPSALLALTPAPALRTWTYPPGKPGGTRPRPLPCARCALPLSPSPSGRHWWPAACTHAGPLIPSGTGMACAACGHRNVTAPRRPCSHRPATGTPHPAGGIPADVEAEIAGLEVVRAGDGWVTCLTPLGGQAAALDILELHQAMLRLLGETPAPPDWLDGASCRECGSYALFRAPLPAGPEDPHQPPAYSECAKCRHRMSGQEYAEWTKLNAAHARHSSGITCRRCLKHDCAECSWKPCACTTGPHPRRRAA